MLKFIFFPSSGLTNDYHQLCDLFLLYQLVYEIFPMLWKTKKIKMQLQNKGAEKQFVINLLFHKVKLQMFP
ncbi:hypothetical protein CICLE_v10026897mg [Citrus x clementina]|uniref:Uncharacterized protein n=1 Tax=Citrus clementina TaxID=85681 RepID=V4SPF4_CITCL|nr:hypothetical protein CICLE_v10026897mg [Citrus x clementina]